MCAVTEGGNTFTQASTVLVGEAALGWSRNGLFRRRQGRAGAPPSRTRSGGRVRLRVRQEARLQGLGYQAGEDGLSGAQWEDPECFKAEGARHSGTHLKYQHGGGGTQAGRQTSEFKATLIYKMSSGQPGLQMRPWRRRRGRARVECHSGSGRGRP